MAAATLSLPVESESLSYFMAVHFVVSAFCLMKYDCVCFGKVAKTDAVFFLELVWSFLIAASLSIFHLEIF